MRLLSSLVASNERRRYTFRWLYITVLCFVAILSNNNPNVSSETYMTYDALYGILPSGVVGCISYRWMYVFFGSIFITVKSLYLYVT